jgi:hypothetical protein
VRKRPAALTCAGLVGAAGTVALATVGPSESGCTTHQCDSSTYDYVNGFMEDQTTFVTNALDGQWINYRGQTTVRIWFPKQVLGWIPKTPLVLVGTDPTPNGGDAFVDTDTWAPAAGQLAVFNFLTTAPQIGDGGPFFQFNGAEYGGYLEVTNGSCAIYFAHVEVDFIPVGDADSGVPEAAAAGVGEAADASGD